MLILLGIPVLLVFQVKRIWLAYASEIATGHVKLLQSSADLLLTQIYLNKKKVFSGFAPLDLDANAFSLKSITVFGF